MVENPVWADYRYLFDESYRSILMEFMAWDVLRVQPYSMEFINGEAKWKFHDFIPIINHWSRLFEYPWSMMKADFKKDDVVLDAGGANALIQYYAALRCKEVINLDLSEHYLKLANDIRLRNYFRNITLQQGNLESILYPDGWFDKVLCISVLEHSENPEKILYEMLRVLKLGGRLIVTMDISDGKYDNFCIDEERAREIVQKFGMYYPPQTDQTLIYNVRMAKGGEDRGFIKTSVLCFCIDKR